MIFLCRNEVATSGVQTIPIAPLEAIEFNIGSILIPKPKIARQPKKEWNNRAGVKYSRSSSRKGTPIFERIKHTIQRKSGVYSKNKQDN